MSGMMTADRIGSAAHFDPQLRTPSHPRLRRGLDVTTTGDQMLISGVPKRQIFRGALATGLLPRMLEQLDGTHDHAALAQQLEVDREVVFKVVSLLWASGVVEDGPGDDAPGDLDLLGTEVADYLSRTGDSTGANATWEQAAGRWVGQRVEVFGDHSLAERLRDEFDQPSPVHVPQAPLPSAEAGLVVLCQGDTIDASDASDWADGAAEAVVAECWRRGLPLIRFRVAAGVARIGPYVDPATTPCLDCLVAVEQDTEPHERAVPRTGASDRRLALALLARELFSVVTRSTPSPLPSRWRVVELAELSGTELTGATRPGCPRCSQLETPDGQPHDASLAIQYEAAVAMPPKAFADNKAHQMHYKPSNLDLQQKFRSWPVAPRQALPEPDLSLLSSEQAASERAAPGRDSGTGQATRGLTAHDLSVVLTTAAGLQEVTAERVLRWTACGGNIGSVVAHVVVRDCAGVPPGIYAWLPEQGALALLDPDPASVPGEGAASLVLTGDYLKVAQKYAAFALRIVLLDSGCAQAAACEVAGALGVSARRRQRWDDVAVAEAVGASPDTEPVTAVIELGGTR